MLGFLSHAWLWDLYCFMAGIAWGLWSTYFVSALWCGLWISQSFMHLPPHDRLGPREWRERLFRERLCFTWLLASNFHSPQSLLAWGNVGSYSRDPQRSAEKGTLCTCEVWNEEGMVRERGREARTSPLQPPLQTLTKSHPAGKETCIPSCALNLPYILNCIKWWKAEWSQGLAVMAE